MTQAGRYSTTRGFKQAGGLMERRIKDGAQARGFAVSRLLTHWAEIVGPEVAATARPVNVSYGRGSLGATLVLLTTGARAPMLEMQKERIRERVNACYGYSAIARVRITQTAPVGFAEGLVAFEGPPKTARAGPAPELRARAAETAQDVRNDTLRAALESLGANVMNKGRKGGS